MQLLSVDLLFILAGPVFADSWVQLDDRDPSLQYSDGWFAESSDQEYLGTGMQTNQTGATVALTFTGASNDLI